MLSIVIQEHNEGRQFVRAMLDQAANLQMQKEVIYVTSMKFQEFYDQYGPFKYKFPVSVFGNIQSCGAARNVGGQAAVGQDLLYVDSHVCMPNSQVQRVLDTLDMHPDSIVAPAIQPIDFPSCTPQGGAGHGVAFRFVEKPFEWVWTPAERYDREFKVPFVCGCAFAMKKTVFNLLNSYGGFLGMHTGLSWEEEKSMRLYRLGSPTYMEPRATFGHYFKGHPNHKQWDPHSTSGYYQSRVVGAYINIFDPEVWDRVEQITSQQWGQEWYKYLDYAKTNYSWLRNLFRPLANKIDEKWFLQIR